MHKYWLKLFQDFESWDDVGLNIAQPPDLLHLYRDYSSHVMPTSDHCEGGCQTELEIHDINSLEGELESVKIELVMYSNIYFLVDALDPSQQVFSHVSQWGCFFQV